MLKFRAMVESNSPKSLIEAALSEKAERRFGSARAAELKPDIEQTAIQLAALASEPLSMDDES